MTDEQTIGQQIYDLARELFPICRSITGEGVRQTLRILQRHLPELVVHEIPSGQQCLDWTVPDEWNITDAYIVGPDGHKIVDFATSNLHVVGYSVPIDTVLSLEQLKEHIYTLPDQPDAIPYVTSYYQRRWGFCMTHAQFATLSEGQYRAVIRSSITPGVLN